MSTAERHLSGLIGKASHPDMQKIQIIGFFFENRLHWQFEFRLLLFTYVLTYYLLTYLLTPWSRVLLEKLTGLQLVKKFPAFYGTRRFIIAFTSARHLMYLRLKLSTAHDLQL
jgi:hypothetical protein